MHNEYLVVINGKPTGPYTFDQLKDLNINSQTFVKAKGMDDFKEAHAIEELRELFGFSKGFVEPQYFAGFDQRLLALAIDYFFFLAIYVLAILCSFAFISNSSERLVVFFTFLPSIVVAKFIYTIFAESSIKSATWGKRLVGIKVTNLQGQKITLSQSILRNVSKLFSIIPLGFGYIYCFFNSKNQCWHDIPSNCVVIKDRLL
jgi:uncharacterized RDD family membrane protein YckC